MSQSLTPINPNQASTVEALTFIPLTPEHIDTYTKGAIIEQVQAFNRGLGDPLDEWEARGYVTALNNLRAYFGMEYVPHNLDEDGPDYPTYLEDEEEEDEDEMPDRSMINCDGCGNFCHKYNIAQTENGNLCQHCNQPEDNDDAQPTQQKGDLSIELDEKYWDCECEHHYIHAKADRLTCPVCGAEEENQPDSRVNEIQLAREPGRTMFFVA